ncbi:hypothetical protein [Ureibacillus terrenus]|uniref:Uncharacterized protein n=1 Tax=Ureibacillus terrenus TaxID=118246 RepID=A0A540UW13_9BACL|nr:hypothetical protein [Ureibacillus terrenus]TQE88661.1 hypothetical protein FKZ59_13550 [Ureibacillus terrenus]
MKKLINKFLYSKYSELVSLSFTIPAVLFIILYKYFFNTIEKNMILSFYDEYSTTFIGASASIFGISLAALSVFISVIYKPAIPKMIENNLLEVFLFPFLINIILWAIVSFLSIFTLFVNFSPIIACITTYKSIYFTFFIYFICVSFIYTISLAIHVIKTTIISFSGKSASK